MMEMSVRNTLVWTEEEAGRWSAASGICAEDGNPFHYRIMPTNDTSGPFCYSLLMSSDELGVNSDESYSSLDEARAVCQEHEDFITRPIRIRQVFGELLAALEEDAAYNLSKGNVSMDDEAFDVYHGGTDSSESHVKVGHLRRARNLLTQLESEWKAGAL